ncbi:MAG: tetratricopeptide repeat protein [Acidobacteriota bacterium]|jgi:tetratricopeptide (TPR) repeat protein
MKFLVKSICLGVLLSMTALGVSAQLSKGFYGHVIGPDGKPVANAQVTFQDQSNLENTYKTKTNEKGYYSYAGLPYSTKGYQITAEIPDLPPMIMMKNVKVGQRVEVTLDASTAIGFQGKVLDEKGGGVAGAVITIENLADSKTRTIKSERGGAYKITNLPYSEAGYKLSVKTPAGKTESKSIRINQMATLQVDFDFGKDEQASGPAASNDAADAKDLYTMGDYQGALEKADKALQTKDKSNRKAALFIKAASLKELGRTDEAIAAFEQYNSEYSGNKDVVGILSDLYDKKGDKAKADKYRKLFVQLGGKLTMQNYNDGVKALNAGKAKEAVGLFRKAITDDPSNADAHRELARALAQTGDYAGAIEQLKLYLKKKPNASDAAQWENAIKTLEPLAKQQK